MNDDLNLELPAFPQSRAGRTQYSKASRPNLDLFVPVDDLDHALGARHAAVTIVEYGDFECPTCKQTAPVLKHLLKRYPDRLKLVYRHFPLENFHAHALTAAEAAECAGTQGKFWQMHELLFANQAHLERKHLECYAERLELDLVRFRAQMDEHACLQQVRKHIDGGRCSQVRAAPSLFLNGKVVDVSFGPRALVDATTRALVAR